jgi:predicted DCC family thiol-disulfide oxidoreductase YuxK
MRVADPPERPLLLWDGDCGFCRGWVERWRLQVAHAVDTAPYQEAGARFPEIPVAHFQQAVQLVEPDGEVSSGAEAIFRAFALGGHPAILALYNRSSIFAGVTRAVYGWVAGHRVTASRITRGLMGRDARPPTYRLARAGLVRGVGLVALVAFVSAWTQVDGLLGSRGIAPAYDLLRAVSASADQQGIGLARYWLVPTAMWIMPLDGMLQALPAIGSLAALGLLCDFWALPAAVVAWCCYLSLVTVGDPFFGYQWDALLLESLVAVMFVARLRPSHDRSDTRGLVVARLVFFKLMLMSGLVKLASHDPTWAQGRALDFHFWTQPLPTRLAWDAAHWPHPILTALTYLVLGIELVFPFVGLGSRRMRRAAFVAFLLLQLGIVLTGSYGFFNLLTLVLALPLLDDECLLRLARKVARRPAPPSPSSSAASPPAPPPLPTLRTRLRAWTTGVFLFFSLAPLADGVLPGPILALAAYATPLRSTNSYGLFAVMTTVRDEIVLEGSDDGVNFVPYVLPYQPGPVGRAPRWTVLGMPRLDWQMWFAALAGDCRRARWFLSLEARIFEGSPPRYLRARTTPSRFTTPAERAASGDFWARDRGLERSFCPRIEGARMLGLTEDAPDPPTPGSDPGGTP